MTVTEKVAYLKGLAKGLDLAQDKAETKMFDAIMEVLEDMALTVSDLEDGHGTGHGVGIEIHEQPVLSPVSKQTLAPGHVVTVEPGIYLPGRFGVRIEDMAFLTQDGCKNLTNAPKDLIVLPG